MQKSIDGLVEQIKKIKQDITTHEMELMEIESFIYSNVKMQLRKSERIAYLKRLIVGKKKLVEIVTNDFNVSASK